MFSFLFILPLIGSVKSEAYPRKLEPDEENKLLQEMKNGSREARGKLIEHNLRLAHIAKKYDNASEDKDDILSIGIVGLIKGIDTFKFDSNNKLSTYCSRCIENEILMTLRSNKNKKNYVYLLVNIILIVW